MTSIGRPGEDRKYTATDKAYLKKTAKKRAERNKDRRELLKAGAKLSSKVKGSTKSKKGCKTEAGHTTDFKDGGSKKTPVKAQCVKENRGWRKGKGTKKKT